MNHIEKLSVLTTKTGLLKTLTDYEVKNKSKGIKSSVIFSKIKGFLSTVF